MAKTRAKEEKKEKKDFPRTCAGIFSAAVTVFMLVLAAVLPLIFDIAYYNILDVKYWVCYMSILCMAAVCLLLALAMFVVDLKEFHGCHAGAVLKALLPKNWRTTFSAGDIAVLLYWLVCLVSTLRSDFLYESFWGNEGRCTGLFLTTLYVLLYFLVTRLWRGNRLVHQAFLIAGLAVALLGVSDYFEMDLLDFYALISERQYLDFTSTIGNINSFTAYVGMIMGFAAALFASSETVKSMLWYYVCLVISFIAIIMGRSDNAYISLGILFVFLPFILFRTQKGTFRYVVILATFVSVLCLIDWINTAFADSVRGVNSLFNYLVAFGGMPFIAAGLWAAAAVYQIWLRRQAGKTRALPDGADEAGNPPGEKTARLRLVCWTVFVGLSVLAVLFLWADANFLGNAERYRALGKYLVFDDSWGTNRGYIWRKSLEMYNKFSLERKLIGFGPDTFGILTTEYIRREMVRSTGQIFDSAHNEYLQLLLTVGIAGLVSYLSFLGLSMRRMFRNLEKSPYVFGCLTAVLCYVCQAAVNINVPIAAPVMWLLLSTGIALVRHAQDDKKGEE